MKIITETFIDLLRVIAMFILLLVVWLFYLVFIFSQVVITIMIGIEKGSTAVVFQCSETVEVLKGKID